MLPVRILQCPDNVLSILNLSRRTYILGKCRCYNSVTVYNSTLGIPCMPWPCSKDIHPQLLVGHYVLLNTILAGHLLICLEIVRCQTVIRSTVLHRNIRGQGQYSVNQWPNNVIACFLSKFCVKLNSKEVITVAVEMGWYIDALMYRNTREANTCIDINFSISIHFVFNIIGMHGCVYMVVNSIKD